MQTRTYTQQDGIALLITLLLMGVLLGISTALLTVTLKQYQLSGIAFQSEIAFQAANAAMECAHYHHQPGAGNGIFYETAVTTKVRLAANSFYCFNFPTSADLVGGAVGSKYDGSGAESNEQRFQFSWGSSPEVCSEFSVYIFHEPQVGSIDSPIPVTVDGVTQLRSQCPEGGTCSVIKARGYNVPCGEIYGGGRVVEREFIVVY